VSDGLARSLERMGIRDPRVLKVFAETPRERFVPPALGGRADGDHPLPIGFGQTISQPFMVAWMTEALGLRGRERVLEVGTGSGYQAAILARLCAKVFTVERIPELSYRARATLAALGIANVALRVGDGSRGWPEEAPYEGIVVTAAAPRIPTALLDQLRPGGTLVIPVGAAWDGQRIHLVRRDVGGRLEDAALFGVRFVPLREEAEGVEPEAAP
jgi:protein-L-isoaspartate(D-aspartate) O-methyltransferase